jgi:hypothetical protein
VPSSARAFAPEPEPEPAGVPSPPPASERSLVLMIPDLPGDDLDDRLLGAIEAHREEGSRVDVVRYDPITTRKADIVATSQRRAGEFMARGVLWVDIREDDRLAVYLYEVDTDRFLGRRIASSPDARAAAIETLANITASIVAESAAGPVEGLDEVDPDSLVDTQSPPEPEPAPPEPVPPPEPAPPPLEWPRLWLGVAYAGSTFSREILVQHGLALSAAWGPAPGAFIGVRYDLVLPSRVDEADVSFQLRRHPVAIEGGYRLAFGRRRRADFEASLRVVVDPIRRLSDDASSGRPVTDDALRVFSSIAPGLGIGFSPIRQVRLGVRIGPELVTSRARYVVAGAAGGAAVDPAPVRGFVEAGLQFGLLWRPRAPREASQEF